MPMLIEHIDAIARKIGRGVLFVDFPACHIFSLKHVDHEKYKPRKKIIRWLDENRIAWRECARIASEDFMTSYEGQIYIDIPFDENDPVYKKVDGFLEREDGTPRIAGSIFYYLPLELAMRNKHHDEPGYWEKWAENL